MSGALSRNDKRVLQNYNEELLDKCKTHEDLNKFVRVLWTPEQLKIMALKKMKKSENLKEIKKIYVNTQSPVNVFGNDVTQYVIEFISDELSKLFLISKNFCKTLNRFVKLYENYTLVFDASGLLDDKSELFVSIDHINEIVIIKGNKFKNSLEFTKITFNLQNIPNVEICHSGIQHYDFNRKINLKNTKFIDITVKSETNFILGKLDKLIGVSIKHPKLTPNKNLLGIISNTINPLCEIKYLELSIIDVKLFKEIHKLIAEECKYLRYINYEISYGKTLSKRTIENLGTIVFPKNVNFIILSLCQKENSKYILDFRNCEKLSALSVSNVNYQNVLINGKNKIGTCKQNIYFVINFEIYFIFIYELHK